MTRKLTAQEKMLKFIKKDKKKTKKRSFILLIATAVLMAGYILFAEPEPVEITGAEDNTVYTATMVGDIMFGRHVEEVTDRYGKEYLFRFVRPLFEESDYVTGNFEHPVLLEDGYEKQDKYIHLGTDAESVQTLKDLNFSSVTIANNHTMDYGVEGLRDTIDTFEEVGLDAVGAGYDLEDASRISYQTDNGITTAMIGISDSYVKGARAFQAEPGVLPADPDVVLPLIKEASDNANLVIVNVHWGVEYNDEPNPRQRDLARAMADAGADLIVGHHPHVLSSVETYNDSVIFYSLGNFVFDQGWSRTRDSVAVQYKLEEDGKARIEAVPLRIREATPAPIGDLGGFHEQRIFYQLTKGTNDKDGWKQENGRLIYEMDHSHVLEGEALIGE